LARSTLPTISSLWIGPRLSFLEQLCLKSFADAGHETKLYAYGKVDGVPDGVTVADAGEIMPASQFIVNTATGSPGPHSDRFRYLLLDRTDEIWADTDAYCVKPFPASDYFFASHFRDLVNNGVLRLPRTSRTLRDLLDFTATEYPELPADFTFLTRSERADYDKRRATPPGMHVSELPWEIWGPFALTYFLQKNGESEKRVPSHVLYPLIGGDIRRALQMPRNAKIRLPEDCLSIHFYGSRIRGLLKRRNGVPEPKSLLGSLCAKHGINAADAPILD